MNKRRLPITPCNMITKKHVEFDKYFIKEKIEAKKNTTALAPFSFVNSKQQN
jgi:hypothetical protein